MECFLLLNHWDSSIALRSLARDSPALLGVGSAAGPAGPPFSGGWSVRCVGAGTACTLAVWGGYEGARGACPALLPIGSPCWSWYMVLSMCGKEGTSKSVFGAEDMFWMILSRLPRDLAESVDHMSRSCGVKPGGVLGLNVAGYRWLRDFIGVVAGGEGGGGDGGKICINFGSFLQNLVLPDVFPSPCPCLIFL